MMALSNSSNWNVLFHVYNPTYTTRVKQEKTKVVRKNWKHKQICFAGYRGEGHNGR